MTFGNAHIKSAFGILFHHDVHAASGGHCGCHTHDVGICFGKFKQGFAKDILIAQRLIFVCAFKAFSRLGIELARRMPDGGILFRCGETFSFCGVYVEHLRSGHSLDTLQGMHQRDYVVSVQRPEVTDVHSLEHILLIGQQGLQRVVETQNFPFAFFVEPSQLEQFLGHAVSQRVVPTARMELMQIIGHASHTAVNTHIVVVQNDEQIVGHGAGVVQSFVSQTATHTAIANDGNHLAVFIMQIGSHSHSQSR